MDQHHKFYLVWCESGNVPTVKHPNHTAACDEAERLARNVPGKTFHVLECVSSVKRSDLMWTGEMPVPF